MFKESKTPNTQTETSKKWCNMTDKRITASSVDLAYKQVESAPDILLGVWWRFKIEWMIQILQNKKKFRRHRSVQRPAELFLSAP